MDQPTSESSKGKLRNLSAFRKRIQAPAAILRTLSPFCARTTRLDSVIFEEGKSLLAFSGLLHGCNCSSTTAINDVHVPKSSYSATQDLRAEPRIRKGKLKAKDYPKSDQEKKKLIKSSGSFNSLESDGKVNSRVMVLMDDREGHGKNKADHAYNKVKGNFRVLNKPDDSFSKMNNMVFEKPRDSCNRKDSRVRVWMEESLPIVKYSYEPCVDFYDSMLEMVMGKGGLRDLQEMEDMFACYVVLNSPHNHHHIEKAFTNLLTDLYKSKVLTFVGFDGFHTTYHNKKSSLIHQQRRTIVC